MTCAAAFGLFAFNPQKVEAGTRDVTFYFADGLIHGKKVQAVLISAPDGSIETSSMWEPGSSVRRKVNYGKKGKTIRIVAKVKHQGWLWFISGYTDVVKDVWVGPNTSHVVITP